MKDINSRLPTAQLAHWRWRMKQIAPRIVVDQKVRFGKPVIKGTRVPVELVIAKLAGGMTMSQVQKEYDLTKADVLAALDYAAKTVAAEEVRAVK